MGIFFGGKSAYRKILLKIPVMYDILRVVKRCAEVTVMLLNGEKKRINIGYEDFKETVDGGFYYVDKTMFIYDLLRNGGKNNLITRPRRFGKTLNMSMLRYFFDITEKQNAYLFDGFMISKHYDELKGHRNAYPVITLSLKCAKKGCYEDAVYWLCKEIQRQFRKHRYISDCDRVDSGDRDDFKKIIAAEPDVRLFAESIKLLSSCLAQYYGKNTIILIDEYDVPLEDACFCGYYDKMVSFIRSLFESALKTNPSLEFSVITGCLRISKESIFTGLNNLAVNGILSPRYSGYFGFEEDEVKDILEYYGVQEKFETAKRWYDGYLFGNTEVYNPWSIMNYVADLCDDPNSIPAADWVNSSSNSIIKTLVESADDATRDAIEQLINGGCVKTPIYETVTYGDLGNDSENIWSFLFFTGYLRLKELVTSGEETGDEAIYSLAIPNLEIKSCYNSIIKRYFESCKKSVNRDDLYKAILSRDAEGFSEQITELLKKSISYYDNGEQFYHGLIAGLLAGNVHYRMASNRETGTGRSDLILYQNDLFVNAVIMEFKVCKANEAADKAAERALRQIDERDYAREARDMGYSNIIKFGVAFKSKVCYAVTE